MGQRMTSGRPAEFFMIQTPPRALQPEKGDLAGFGLGELDMNRKLIRRFFERAPPQRPEDGRVFLVGNTNARGLGEIQTTHDTNSFCHIPMHADKLRIPRRGDNTSVKVFVPSRHLADVGITLLRRNQPAHLERGQRGIQLFRRQSRQSPDGPLLKQDS